jgi:L-ascorbate metabolism protein UlaG (beta-lactamase superfamily)
MMVSIRFLGHACFAIEGEGLKAIVDPFLSGSGVAPVDASNFNDRNYIFVTHGHGDHIGDTVDIAKASGATVIATVEVCHYLAAKGAKCHPMQVGGVYRFPFGKVKMTPAWHGSGITEGDQMICGGMPGGFLLEVEGKKIYHAGDTGLTMEMKLLEEETVDVALLPIGGNFTMDIDDAVRAVKLIRPRIVVPMHYDTFDVIKADPGEFAAKASEAAEVRILDIGESMEL